MSGLKKAILDHLVQEVFCRLGVSPLHGIGVFAIRPIAKGLNPLKSRISHRGHAMTKLMQKLERLAA